MRPTLGVGQLALGGGVPVAGIHSAVVTALRGGGMAWCGDGAEWWAGYRLLGGRWCGGAVLGQIR